MRLRYAAGTVCVVALALVTVTACAVPPWATRATPATPSVTARATATPVVAVAGGPGCHPPSPVTPSAIALPEVHGQSSNGELWALLFNDLRAGQEIKIVWRMTGTGNLHLVALGPRGQRVAPVWGPEQHSSSNWNRPGDEWGAGFTFPIAGCWDIHAARDDVSGDVWLVLT